MSLKYFCISILFLVLNNSTSLAQSVEDQRQSIHDKAIQQQAEMAAKHQLKNSLFRLETAVEEKNTKAVSIMRQEISGFMEQVLTYHKRHENYKAGYKLWKQFDNLKLNEHQNFDANLIKSIPNQFVGLF